MALLRREGCHLLPYGGSDLLMITCSGTISCMHRFYLITARCSINPACMQQILPAPPTGGRSTNRSKLSRCLPCRKLDQETRYGTNDFIPSRPCVDQKMCVARLCAWLFSTSYNMTRTAVQTQAVNENRKKRTSSIRRLP